MLGSLPVFVIVVLCEPVPWWRKKKREGDFSLPFIGVPHFPLCSLWTPSRSLHQGVLVHDTLGRCRATSFCMWYFHSSRGLTEGCIASLHWRFQMTALPDSLTVRHPVICVVMMSNTLSSQQKYLGREALLGVGARLSCMSTLNFAVRCEPG